MNFFSKCCDETGKKIVWGGITVTLITAALASHFTRNMAIGAVIVFAMLVVTFGIAGWVHNYEKKSKEEAHLLLGAG